MAEQTLYSIQFPGSINFISQQLAAEYDSTATYAIGDYCVKAGQLYRCKTSIATAETWTASHWTSVYVTDEIKSGGSSGAGLTSDVKSALLTLFEKVAYIDDGGQNYYNTLYTALYPPTNLASISAVFVQGNNVIYDTDNLDTLRQYLTVTATYDNSTTETITTYTLSGTLSEGTSTVTVSYGGKTTTFTVTVSTVSTYTITANLTNVTMSNNTASVTQGDYYTSDVSANTGYESLTVTVTMGGTDVTASVYADGRISIDAVTGNVVITASATRTTYTEIYNLANTPVTANADLYEDTGLTFGSSSANGVTKAWTLMGDFVTTATYVHGFSVGTTNTLTLYYNGAASPIPYFCSNSSNTTCTHEGNRCRIVITHSAGVTNKATYHSVVDGAVVATEVSSSYGNLAHSVCTGTLYLGGTDAADFVGTVNAFTIYEGIVDSATIAEFLGVS